MFTLIPEVIVVREHIASVCYFSNLTYLEVLVLNDDLLDEIHKVCTTGTQPIPDSLRETYTIHNCEMIDGKLCVWDKPNETFEFGWSPDDMQPVVKVME